MVKTFLEIHHKHWNKHHLQLSIYYHFPIGVNRPRLKWERIKNHLYINVQWKKRNLRITLLKMPGSHHFFRTIYYPPFHATPLALMMGWSAFLVEWLRPGHFSLFSRKPRLGTFAICCWLCVGFGYVDFLLSKIV